MASKMIRTEFTPEQLQKLSELALLAYSREPSPELHNLSRKLVEYIEEARVVDYLRLVG